MAQFSFNNLQKQYNRSKLPSASQFVLIILAVIIGVALLGFFVIKSGSNDNSALVNRIGYSVVDGKRYSYPTNWVELRLAEGDKASINLRLGTSSTNPPASFTWSSIKGQLASNFDFKKHLQNLVDKISQEYEGSKILDKTIAEIGSYKAVKVTYTRPDPTSKSSTNKLITYNIFAPNVTHTLIFNAKDSEFSKIDSDHQSMVTSLINYINS